MAGIVLPNVPPELRNPVVSPGLAAGLSINKLLTLLDMLKDMFRVSGTKVANNIIARNILNSFGQTPVAAAIATLTGNMSIWESKYKKELTDVIESYAKDKGTFTTHRFFYKKNVALTTESRLPDIIRFVIDVGYDPRVINPGAISLVGHGSTIDNGPRANFGSSTSGTLELFPPQGQILDMSPIYSGMDHICVISCSVAFDSVSGQVQSHTVITAIINQLPVVITIVRDAEKPVADNFVSATYSVNGAPNVVWNKATEGDICAPNDDKNSRANVNANSGTGLQIQDFIRSLLKFLGDEALCITTFIADYNFFQIKSEGRVAIMTGDGMVRLRCLLMGIPFVKQFDGSAQTLERAPVDQKEKIKSCEFEYWCPEGNPLQIYYHLIERAYKKVTSHNDGIKQLLLSAIFEKKIGITFRDIELFRDKESSITCYLNTLVETISYIQILFDIVYNFLKFFADKTPAQIQAAAQAAQAAQAAAQAAAAAATPEAAAEEGALAALINLATAAATGVDLRPIFQHLEISTQGVLLIFGEFITLSQDQNRNARGSEIEAFFKVFKVNSFIERKTGRIVALKLSNLLESSKYISPSIPLTPIPKKPFVDYIFGVIKGTIGYQQGQGGGGGNIQKGGRTRFMCTQRRPQKMWTFAPDHRVKNKPHANMYHIEVLEAPNNPERQDAEQEMMNTYDLHESLVDRHKEVVHTGLKNGLEHICVTGAVSLFEIGHFWLRNLIDYYFDLLVNEQTLESILTHPFLKIAYTETDTTSDIRMFYDDPTIQTRVLVTFLSCYYYEYLEKAKPISGRNSSLCLLDDLYWGINEVISLNGLKLAEHMDSWLMFLVKSQTIPEYELTKSRESKIFYIIGNNIVNNDLVNVVTSKIEINGNTYYTTLGQLLYDESLKFIARRIDIEGNTFYINGELIYDARLNITDQISLVIIKDKTYYRIGQQLYDESFKSIVKIGKNPVDGTEFVKFGHMYYKLKGGSKRKVKSNKRSNKRSNMNRKTRKNRFSLLGKRTPSARMPKTRTKTQSAKPKQRKNRTLRKKHK